MSWWGCAIRASASRSPTVHGSADPAGARRGVLAEQRFDGRFIGVKGSLRLSSDGKWFVPYEADVGDGNKNWRYNAILGAGYHFHWGDITLAVRNLTYNIQDRPIVEKERRTGPALGASFRW